MVDKPRYSNHFRRMAVDIKISNYIGKYLTINIERKRIPAGLHLCN